MYQEGLNGQRKCREVIPTNSNHSLPVAPNALNREFRDEKTIKIGSLISLKFLQKRVGII
jgi:hypothetical protein